MQASGAHQAAPLAAARTAPTKAEQATLVQFNALSGALAAEQAELKSQLDEHC